MFEKRVKAPVFFLVFLFVSVFALSFAVAANYQQPVDSNIDFDEPGNDGFGANFQPPIDISDDEDDDDLPNSFAVILFGPEGLQTSSTILLEYAIISAVDTQFSCGYSVESEIGTVIELTKITSCESPVEFELLEDGEYKIYLRVTDVSSGLRKVEASGFSVALAGGGGDGGGGGGGGGGGAVDLGSFIPFCETPWICTEWEECIFIDDIGVQVRTCEKESILCYADLDEKPDESRFCDLGVSLEEEAAGLFDFGDGFLSGLTGAVIGENGRPTTFGVLFFLALIGVLYLIVSGFTRSGATGKVKHPEISNSAAASK